MAIAAAKLSTVASTVAVVTSTSAPTSCSTAMSISVPNLTTAAGSCPAVGTIEAGSSASLLETFAALARRRTIGGGVSSTGPTASTGSQGGGAVGSNVLSSPAGNLTVAHQQGSSTSPLPRGPNSVSSLVRLALASNFPGQ